MAGEETAYAIEVEDAQTPPDLSHLERTLADKGLKCQVPLHKLQNRIVNISRIISFMVMQAE
jgi:hypothetical protein